MNTADNPQVFLSYAHDDLDTVRRLYDALVEREVNVWFDKGSIRPGKWKKQIEKAIPKSRYFIFCVSSASIKKTADGSGFVDDELQQAYEIARDLDERNFTVVPVRLERDTGHGDHRLSVFQQYDLFEDWGAEVDKLAVYMGGHTLGTVVEEEVLTGDELLIKSLNGKAEVAFYAEEYEKALQFIETILKLDPDDARGWNFKGAVMANLGDIDHALESIEKAISLMPEFAKAHSNRGILVGKQGRYIEALKEFKMALYLNPKYAKAWYGKGLSLRKINRLSEAEEAFTRARELGYEG